MIVFIKILSYHEWNLKAILPLTHSLGSLELRVTFVYAFITSVCPLLARVNELEEFFQA